MRFHDITSGRGAQTVFTRQTRMENGRKMDAKRLPQLSAGQPWKKHFGQLVGILGMP